MAGLTTLDSIDGRILALMVTLRTAHAHESTPSMTLGRVGLWVLREERFSADQVTRDSHAPAVAPLLRNPSRRHKD
ncbi:hypothetical protein JMJ77_0012965 [Colletotrichum scovillei]|uniref:Uncharacterized protein n=1 Tax=Colletotrichum scovillei TaxID=1209932 RepID=A0A9P7R6K4_9PEZI|nr:hypothetical protein JMJ77_0012965 [Colletotrichum scovillei]KAG7069253.1 hypothetical protein JMJ76_0002926 [Colletotrichum scovillei]KAG7073228.1 hypothetical protein JMJ78_0014207 [Colletotrichum scovillei]